MCKAFGFPHDCFADMLWSEFVGWLAARRRMEDGAQPDPYSWKVADPWFSAEAKAERRRAAGL